MTVIMARKDDVSEIKDIGVLLSNPRMPVRLVNFITLYRIVTFPLLLFFLFVGNIVLFKWLLLASFFTDAIDGFLARHYRATSVLGSKLDSIGDDLTVLAAAVGLFVTHFGFVASHKAVFIALFALFIVQVGASLYRYSKISTFHTYLAKTAAVVTAVFLLSVFFLGDVSMPLFISAATITGLELIEEVVLVARLREYRTDVKGLYWVLREDKAKKPEEAGSAL